MLPLRCGPSQRTHTGRTPSERQGQRRAQRGEAGSGELDAEVRSLTRVTVPHGAVTGRTRLCVLSSLSPLSVSLDTAPPEIWPPIPFEDLKACSEEGASRFDAH